jgi:GNAT superfamily N-acetyltransferase
MSAAARSNTVVRAAVSSDLPSVALMLEAYMAESFKCPWEGTLESLARDGLGREFHTVVAARSDSLVGFACWRRVYDLHHCAVGGEVMDMYVRPQSRGSGTALSLVSSVAAQVQLAGGRFVKGTADASLEPVYARVAVVFAGAECYLGGHAFRVFADAAGSPARALIRSLPSTALNHEN